SAPPRRRGASIWRRPQLSRRWKGARNFRGGRVDGDKESAREPKSPPLRRGAFAMTDTLERFLQDLRFDLPPGLVERATAASAAEPGALPRSRGFTPGVGDSDGRKRIGRRTELAAGIAAILLAAIVIG